MDSAECGSLKRANDCERKVSQSFARQVQDSETKDERRAEAACDEK